MSYNASACRLEVGLGGSRWICKLLRGDSRRKKATNQSFRQSLRQRDVGRQLLIKTVVKEGDRTLKDRKEDETQGKRRGEERRKEEKGWGE